MPTILAVLGVGSGVHQLTQLSRIGSFDLQHPTLAESVRVDLTGVIRKARVYLDDFTAHGGVDVGSGLDGLDDTKSLASGDAVTSLGELHVHDVTEFGLQAIEELNRGEVVMIPWNIPRTHISPIEDVTRFFSLR